MRSHNRKASVTCVLLRTCHREFALLLFLTAAMAALSMLALLSRLSVFGKAKRWRCHILGFHGQSRRIIPGVGRPLLPSLRSRMSGLSRTHGGRRAVSSASEGKSPTFLA